MANRLFDRLLNTDKKPQKRYGGKSWLQHTISGSFFKSSNLRNNDSYTTIIDTINTMRALAKDSQISTVLSYYATDATTTNTAGQIIWATSKEIPELGETINALFKRWNINAYARNHILELATVGNLYIPTTHLYRTNSKEHMNIGVALDSNTIPDNNFDIIPSYKISPEDIVHIWEMGTPYGYLYQPDVENRYDKSYTVCPESSVIHFSLGGLLGEYTIEAVGNDGEEHEFDIMFAEPLLTSATSPTQTLNLLEDSILLSSFARVVRFVNVECNDAEEEEIQATLLQIKNVIEQQLSLDTTTGDAQSYVNPQSPNNLIYLPRVNGQDPVSVTDLHITDANEAENKLLDYFQNKKLSVLGVPKEALNFSSAEGLGNAGNVMSQRSALYANILGRLMTAYKTGWEHALNTYFRERGMSGFVDKFELHMNPIVTTQSTIQFEKRDAALSQALNLVNLLKEANVTDRKHYTSALVEILSEVFPQMGASAATWDVNISEGEGDVDGTI